MRALQAICIAWLEGELEAQGTHFNRKKTLTSVQHALLVSNRQENGSGGFTCTSMVCSLVPHDCALPDSCYIYIYIYIYLPTTAISTASSGRAAVFARANPK